MTTTAAVAIPVNGFTVAGELTVPAGASGIVLFSDAGGGSRLTPRNQVIAGKLQSGGLATLLFDLLSPAEAAKDQMSAYWRFDVELLAHRLLNATTWLREQPVARDLGFGYFGASTGSAAALIAAGRLDGGIQAVVSRGGRPDFAAPLLPMVSAATLLIVGEKDEGTLSLNRTAFHALKSVKQLAVIGGATRLFEEPGALAEVALLATTWFQAHLHHDFGAVPQAVLAEPAIAS